MVDYAIKVWGIGAAADDGNGDPLRNGIGKLNDNWASWGNAASWDATTFNVTFSGNITAPKVISNQSRNNTPNIANAMFTMEGSIQTHWFQKRSSGQDIMFCYGTGGTGDGSSPVEMLRFADTEFTIKTGHTLIVEDGAAFLGDVTIDGFLKAGDGSVLTLASGVITATSSFHILDPEGSSGPDDLTQILGGDLGKTLILRGTSNGIVTVKDQAGLRLAGDFAMTNANATMMLLCTASGIWIELSRSNNG